MGVIVPEFEEVFSTYAGFAWRVLARYGVPERDLEDACQEVFMVVHRGLAGFEGRSSLKTWLYGICRRVAANQRRRAVARHEVPSAEVPEPPNDESREGEAFEVLSCKESLALLDALLARLAPEQREVFELYELEELSMRDIAESLDCSQSTAFSRLYAARREIEAELKRLRARRRVA